MRKNIIIAFISTATLSAHSVNARETVISTGISTGIDYTDRSYDDTESEDELIPPPPENQESSLPPEDGMDMGTMPSRDDERSSIVISPNISIFTETTSDSALLHYKPSINYDLIEDESNDINHEASAGYQRELTDNWDLKIYDVFKNTDEFETSRPNEESLSNSFLEELTSSIPSMNDTLRDEFGSTGLGLLSG